jgi:hypothetical protein
VAASTGKQCASIESNHREFILQQHIFFTASTAAEGRVNLSPKDRASLRILDASRVAYLDLTGSGNETAAHLRANGRLTLMFCAFEGAPTILRLYGCGKMLRAAAQAIANCLPQRLTTRSALAPGRSLFLRLTW